MGAEGVSRTSHGIERGCGCGCRWLLASDKVWGGRLGGMNWGAGPVQGPWSRTASFLGEPRGNLDSPLCRANRPVIPSLA